MTNTDELALSAPEPDDAPTIDGADLLAEIRALHQATGNGALREFDPLPEPRHRPPTDRADTAPTHQRWCPEPIPTDDVIEIDENPRLLSRPQRIALAVAAVIGLVAAGGVWFTAGEGSIEPTPEASEINP